MRLKPPILTLIIFLLVVMLVMFLYVLNTASVHAQEVTSKVDQRPDVKYFEMPVCDEESLKNRSPHPPELTSCSDIIVWQNLTADNLGIPVVTRDKYDKKGKIIQEGNFDRLVADGKLVQVKSTQYLEVAMRPNSYAYAAPQVREYFERKAAEFYAARHKKLILISLLRFHETRDEGSMHRRGLGGDLTCINLTLEDMLVLQKLLVADVQKNKKIQPTEESIKIYRRVSKRRKILVGHRVVAYHVVIFNASFMTPH